MIFCPFLPADFSHYLGNNYPKTEQDGRCAEKTDTKSDLNSLVDDIRRCLGCNVEPEEEQLALLGIYPED